MLEIFLLILFLILIAVTGMPILYAFVIFVLLEMFCLPGTWLMLMLAPPFVPTGRKTRKAMLGMANIQKGEKVYDLGCGDGRLVFDAAAKGASAIGYEFSIPVFLLAKARSLSRLNAKIEYADFWKQSYQDADVIFCYLLKDAMKKFETTIWPQLKPGCRVVSNSFRLPSHTELKKETGAFLYRK